jgi:hypothetical protein
MMTAHLDRGGHGKDWHPVNGDCTTGVICFLSSFRNCIGKVDRNARVLSLCFGPR